MPSKTHFNKYEKAILKIVFESQRTMSIKEVAEEADMSWATAKKYIERLIERGWLEWSKER